MTHLSSGFWLTVTRTRPAFSRRRPTTKYIIIICDCCCAALRSDCDDGVCYSRVPSSKSCPSVWSQGLCEVHCSWSRHLGDYLLTWCRPSRHHASIWRCFLHGGRSACYSSKPGGADVEAFLHWWFGNCWAFRRLLEAARIRFSSHGRRVGHRCSAWSLPLRR